MNKSPNPNTIHKGDSVEVLRAWPDSFVDAVVTDPPYGIRFMGAAWDGEDIERQVETRKKYTGDDSIKAGVRGGHKSVAAYAGKYNLSPSANQQFQEWSRTWASECLRVMKPGAHLICFASTRTYHRMAVGVEDAGFEVRDQIGWLFGSGFPKSHNLDGAWSGWGTALKPAWEPVILARKPISEGTVAANVLKWGTGAINIDGCRIPTNDKLSYGSREIDDGIKYHPMPKHLQKPGEQNKLGRWPANVVHDGSDEVLAAFPNAPGQQGYTGPEFGEKKSVNCFGDFGPIKAAHPRGDAGSAARFFYCAKASREDRNEGLDGMPVKPLNWSSGEKSPGTFQSPNTERDVQNHHPTVKPTDLMRHLCRLVTPAGGLILDPFFGSGSTGKAAIREGFFFLGIEREAEYVEIARRRIAAELAQGRLL